MDQEEDFQGAVLADLVAADLAAAEQGVPGKYLKIKGDYYGKIS